MEKEFRLKKKKDETRNYLIEDINQNELNQNNKSEIMPN